MSHITTARWLLTLPLASSAFGAFAQAAPPLSTYRSAMAGYRSFADEKPVPWKEANEIVHRRGGWKAYATEAETSGAAEDRNEAHGHAGHAVLNPSTPHMPNTPQATDDAKGRP
ncbi:hypothetical protein [Variovorax ginsengisoli]|uniref:DUF4148 domain-containing protein n=1 Tax=Variovorax ginsengisoli TaxID=363844 RepID=A0ABT9S3F7_9BURK|nr:hypothetical protein [Variovorax ginsengisoli]MDP9898306.1 hypothetical protein [Variovorax ginsengisoli]